MDPNLWIDIFRKHKGKKHFQHPCTIDPWGFQKQEALPSPEQRVSKVNSTDWSSEHTDRYVSPTKVVASPKNGNVLINKASGNVIQNNVTTSQVREVLPAGIPSKTSELERNSTLKQSQWYDDNVTVEKSAIQHALSKTVILRQDQSDYQKERMDDQNDRYVSGIRPRFGDIATEKRKERRNSSSTINKTHHNTKPMSYNIYTPKPDHIHAKPKSSLIPTTRYLPIGHKVESEERRIMRLSNDVKMHHSHLKEKIRQEKQMKKEAVRAQKAAHVQVSPRNSHRMSITQSIDDVGAGKKLFPKDLWENLYHSSGDNVPPIQDFVSKCRSYYQKHHQDIEVEIFAKNMREGVELEDDSTGNDQAAIVDRNTVDKATSVNKNMADQESGDEHGVVKGLMEDNNQLNNGVLGDAMMEHNIDDDLGAGHRTTAVEGVESEEHGTHDSEIHGGIAIEKGVMLDDLEMIVGEQESYEVEQDLSMGSGTNKIYEDTIHGVTNVAIEKVDTLRDAAMVVEKEEKQVVKQMETNSIVHGGIQFARENNVVETVGNATEQVDAHKLNQNVQMRSNLTTDDDIQHHNEVDSPKQNNEDETLSVECEEEKRIAMSIKDLHLESSSMENDSLSQDDITIQEEDVESDMSYAKIGNSYSIENSSIHCELDFSKDLHLSRENSITELIQEIDSTTFNTSANDVSAKQDCFQNSKSFDDNVGMDDVQVS